MAKANIQEQRHDTSVDEEATVAPGHHAKNAGLAWYKTEKGQGFEPDFDWEDWPEADGDLCEEELDSLLYEMSTEANLLT